MRCDVWFGYTVLVEEGRNGGGCLTRACSSHAARATRQRLDKLWMTREYSRLDGRAADARGVRMPDQMFVERKQWPWLLRRLR
jgi:hypothetical protein